MSRLSRTPWSWFPGLELLPPTLMVAMGHPWLGAGTLGAVLGVSALQSWMHIRSVEQQHRAVLSYAQDTTNMGGDPSPVIAALRGERSTGGPKADSAPPTPGAAAEARGPSPWGRPPERH
jgi:hypothetical protein